MNYDQNNIFAKIIRKEIPVNLFLESEYSISFEDIKQRAKFHYLIIPKGYYVHFDDFQTNASKEEIIDFYQSIQTVAQRLNLNNGYRLITNCGDDASQEVPHFHMHLLGGEKLKQHTIHGG